MMMPGTKHMANPRIVSSSMNHGIGGIPSKVAVRPDWLEARNFSAAKNCIALTIISSLPSEVLLFETLSAVDCSCSFRLVVVVRRVQLCCCPAIWRANGRINGRSRRPQASDGSHRRRERSACGWPAVSRQSPLPRRWPARLPQADARCRRRTRVSGPEGRRPRTTVGADGAPTTRKVPPWRAGARPGVAWRTTAVP